MTATAGCKVARIRAAIGGGDPDLAVEVVAGGPALVRGAREILDDDGVAHAVTRPVVAVCLCGLSRRAPWCDATHKAIRSAGRD